MHKKPWYPGAHPFRQVPFVWKQSSWTRHSPHTFLQSFPNVPLSHARKNCFANVWLCKSFFSTLKFINVPFTYVFYNRSLSNLGSTLYHTFRWRCYSMYSYHYICVHNLVRKIRKGILKRWNHLSMYLCMYPYIHISIYPFIHPSMNSTLIVPLITKYYNNRIQWYCLSNQRAWTTTGEDGPVAD